MVYTESGLPIYSKCFGTFCSTASKNPELLSGLLSALQTIPLTLSDSLTLEAVKMGSTDLRFSKSLPSGHSIVVGLSEDDEEVANAVFEAINKILQSERFERVNWDYITSDLMNEFEKDLVDKILPEALHAFGGFSDQCALGAQCPLHTNAEKSRSRRIWEAVKSNYQALRERMKRK